MEWYAMVAWNIGFAGRPLLRYIPRMVDMIHLLGVQYPLNSYFQEAVGWRQAWFIGYGELLDHDLRASRGDKTPKRPPMPEDRSG